MKQKRTILFFLCVLLLSAGCSRAVKEEEVLEVSTDEAGPEAADEGEGTAEEARRAFGEVLWNVYFKGVVPDGEKLDYTGTESVQENLFTVMDVDGDGQEELLLFWVNAFMGGQNCFIFGYRDGAVYEELRAFPLLTFYDNGMIKADWSHNHNLGLDFWPYHVYRYDEESGAYQYAGGVDTWDRSVRGKLGG